MNVYFPPPPPAVLVSLLIAVGLQAAALVLLWGFEHGLFARWPKLIRFGLRVLLAVLSFAFAFALLVEFRSGHLEIAARVALSAWMIFATGAIGWSFFRGWISRDSPAGWSLIVATILCVFAALMSDPNGGGREAARRTQCRNNLKQMATALFNYAKTNGPFPPAVEHEKGGPAISWRVTFLGATPDPPAVSYDKTQSWDAPANRTAATSAIGLYSCPSNWILRDEQDRWLTSYALVTGPGTIFPGGKSLAPLEISDGAASTLLAVEVAGLQIVWSEPRDVDVSRVPIGINLPGDRVGRSPGLLSAYHPHGALAAMADGHVALLSERIDPKVLRTLTTANGRDAVDPASLND
jgi:hypothetical protein